MYGIVGSVNQAFLARWECDTALVNPKINNESILKIKVSKLPFPNFGLVISAPGMTKVLGG